jgi:hypothetical protein
MVKLDNQGLNVFALYLKFEKSLQVPFRSLADA